MALNLALQVAMARTMTLTAFGMASAFTAFLLIASSLVARGFDNASIRSAAINIAGPALMAARRETVRSVGRTSALLATALILGALYFSLEHQRDLALGCAWMSIGVPALAFLRVDEGWLRGTGSVTLSQVTSTTAAPGLAAIAILVVHGVSGHVSVGTALCARVIPTALGAVLLFLLLSRRTRRSLASGAGPEHFSASELQRIARGLLIVSAATIVISQADVVALSLLSNPAEAGVYAPAARIALALNLVLVAVNFMLAPRVASLSHQRQWGRLQREVTQAAWVSAVLMLLGCIAVGVLARILLSIFGERFSVDPAPLYVLLAGQAVNGLFGPVGTVLNMGGKHQRSAAIMVCAALLDVGLLVVLVPSHGAVGAAAASAAATAFWNVAMAAVARKTMQINVPGKLRGS